MQVEDQIFLHERGITVTKTRFMADNQTFALANITSVTPVEITASLGWPVALVMIGVLVLLLAVSSGGPSSGVLLYGVIGSVVFAGGVFLLIKRKSTFVVMLSTAGGEVKACQSRDGDFILRIVAALNEAIVARG